MEKKQLVIGLDFDNVIIDTTKMFCKEWNLSCSPEKQIFPSMIKTYEFWNDHKVDRDKVWNVFRKIWKNTPTNKIPMLESPRLLNKIAKKHIVNIITHTELDVENFLKEKNIVGINKVIYNTEKWKEDFDILIDDNADMIRKTIYFGKNGVVYHRTWNYNRLHLDLPRIKRLNEIF